MVLQPGPEGYITPEVRLDNFAEAHRLAAGNHPNRAPNAYSVAYSKTHTGAIQHAYGTSAPHGRTHPPLTSEEDQELKNYRNQQAFTYFNMPVPASLMDYPITQCAEYMSLPPVLQAATEVVGSVQVTTVTIHRKNEKDMPMCLNCQAYARSAVNRQAGLVIIDGVNDKVYMSDVTRNMIAAANGAAAKARQRYWS